MIVIPAGTALLNQRIVEYAKKVFPVLENPIGSNRSPEIDAWCKRFGVPLGSPWCALYAAASWQDAGADIPPIDEKKGWHPAKAETWRLWALSTMRFTGQPGFGYAVLYGRGGRAPASHIAPCIVSLAPILMDLEGNTSETGFSREGELTDLKRVNAERLIGYVSPVPLSHGVSA